MPPTSLATGSHYAHDCRRGKVSCIVLGVQRGFADGGCSLPTASPPLQPHLHLHLPQHHHTTSHKPSNLLGSHPLLQLHLIRDSNTQRKQVSQQPIHAVIKFRHSKPCSRPPTQPSRDSCGTQRGRATQRKGKACSWSSQGGNKTRVLLQKRKFEYR